MSDVVELPEAVRRAEAAGEAAAGVADHWTETYGIYVGHDQHVLLSTELKTFLIGCRATSRHGIVMTDLEASLSPFVVQMLRDHGGYWVLYGGGNGPILDAQTGATLTSYEELWWHEPPELVGTPTGDTPVLAFEIHAEHRADERTQIGVVAADVLPLLGGSSPERWGLSEPLNKRFSPPAITTLARAQMPDTSPIYVDGVGSYCELMVSRDRTGLRERLRGGVVQSAEASAAQQLAALASTAHRVLVATLSELCLDAGPRWRRGPHHPERMVAAYLGPAALGRAGLDPATMAERHGGSLVGRTQLPGVVVTFGGSADERLTAYRALTDDVAEGGSHERLEA